MADRRRTSLALLLTAASLFAGTGPAVDDQDRVVIPDSAHRRLVNRVPVRAVPPDFPMERMLLVMKPGPEASASLQRLLKDQQDPRSASYHQWLTPDEFGRRFGPSQAQRDAAALWLMDQGFAIQNVARGGTTITFSGTATQVGRAFRTAIMEFEVDGAVHHGNVSNISLPRALSGFVSGVATLHDLHPKPRPRLLGKPALKRQAQDSNGNIYVGPGDFATIYNLNPLFGKGITGQGVTIGIVGETDIDASDFTAFQSQFSLNYGGTLTIKQTGDDPGVLDPGDEFESSLDTQWSSATAPGASILLVVSPSSATTQGIDLSALYLVDNNLAPVVSLSYGECEADMGGPGSTYVTFYDQLWAQAAGQGISVFVSSGDSGAAGCDGLEITATKGLGVSGLGSTPFNTCVGGSMFTQTGSAYWNTSAENLGTTAKGYVPEGAWNESGLTASGQYLSAGGGGVSICWPKPSWQNAAGLPSGNMRNVPDVSFNASVFNTPTLLEFQGNLQAVGGTSVATPCMAGIAALLIQSQNGQRQGNLNPTLYSLANAQYGASGPTIFHDITTGNNSVPGQIGYNAGAGYDAATGLGSLDANALVSNWVAGANPIQVSVSAPASRITVASGQPVTFAGSATDSDAALNSKLTFQWSFGDGSWPVSGSSQTYAYDSQGTTQVYTAALTATDGLNSGTSAPITITVTPAGVNPVITQPVTSSYAMPGVTVDFAATATSQNSPNITGYAWDFGDGTKATGATTSHAFPENDRNYWLVTVTATDGTGATGSTSIQLLSDTAILMDGNGDGSIDVRDLMTLAAEWNPTAQSSYPNFNGLFIYGDLNADGVVNDLDLNLWLSKFTPAAP